MTESTTVSISDLEARLIYVIHRELGYAVGEPFIPHISLATSQTDQHTFQQLVEHNLFTQDSHLPTRFTLTPAALEAYDAWASTPARPVRAHGVRPSPIADPLTDYRAALIEIKHIIDAHDAASHVRAQSVVRAHGVRPDSTLTEIYQLCEHILDLHETDSFQTNL